MAQIELLNSTGSEQVDRLWRGIIGIFERTFPGRIIGYYVEGSYADQTAIATSDLDLRIVFRHHFVAGEEKAAVRLVATLEASSPTELDIELTDEASLHHSADPMFKLGAHLVYGEEIRESIPLMPIAEWARQRMHAAFWLMINVFSRPHPVVVPLSFPVSNDPFYGYANRTMRLADGQEILTTRNLVRVTGWIATARIAYEAQQYVVRKRECRLTYQRIINTDWRYCIPETAVEQDELRNTLVQTLAYENHFLAVYRHFVLGELTGSDPDAQRVALDFLNRTPLDDPALV